MVKFRSLIIGLAILLLAPQIVLAAPIVRDEAIVIVGGVKELWQLQWAEKPSPVCGMNDFDMATTCPCEGFAYGERGHLSLVRFRAGKIVEQKDLGSLFDDAETPGYGDPHGTSY